jgi:pyruvate dehydrogenase E2 component (dihydrolipoamide acetyltransferase)
MAVFVSIPSLGLAIREATVVKWLKNEGDPVRKGEPLVTVLTEKVTFEVVAPETGVVLKCLVGEKSRVRIGVPIGVVGQPGEQVLAEVAQPAPGEPASRWLARAASVASAPRAREGPVRALPAARRLAREKAIDLTLVRGTGPDGVITREDVEQYVPDIARSGTDPLTGAPEPPAPPAPEDEIIPYTGIRRIIGDHLVKSVSTIPHVSTVAEIDMTPLAELREVLAQSPEREGGRAGAPSYLAFIARAVIETIPEFPLVNASLVDDQIIVKKHVNLGIAVATPDGLMVPVIKNATAMDVYELTVGIERLAEAARSGKLTLGMVLGGTFTISNAGAYGAVLATPIISWPQSTVLWVGRIAAKPAVVDDQIQIRKLMFLVLAYDHRVLDGAVAAQFLQRVRRRLEDPRLIL